MREQTRGELAAAAGVGLLATAMFVTQLPPDVHYGGDCGELPTAAWCLGVAHPTGYPLWLLLTRALISVVPFGPVVWRAALGSALAAGLAVALVALTVSRRSGDRVAGVVAGLVLACDSAFAGQAVLAEVYALHLALLAGLALAHGELLRGRDRRWANVIGLLYGLGLVHHLTIVLAVPGTLLCLAAGRARLGGWRALPGLVARIAGWAVPLLALDAYLPLRAAAHPPLNWGRVDTWPSLVAHLTGRRYSTTLLDVSADETRRFVVNHLRLLGYDQGWAIPALLGGLVVLLRRDLAQALWVVALMALSVRFGAGYKVGDRLNYMLPLHLGGALLAGVGVGAARAALAIRAPEWATGPRARLLACFWLLIPLLPAPPTNVPPLRRAMDLAWMGGNRHAARQVDAVFDGLPRGATLISALDELTNAVWYRQVVENRRRDVRVVQRAWLDTPQQQQRLLDAVAEGLRAGRVFVSFWDDSLSRRYWLEPGAATCEVWPPGTRPSRVLGPRAVQPGWELPGCPDWLLLPPRLAAPNTELRAGQPAPVLKPRALGRVTAQLVVARGGTRDWDLVCLALHHGVEDWLAGRLSAVPAVMNESSGQVRAWWLTRVPLPTLPARTAADRGRVLTVPVALWAPDRCLNGEYRVRIGLVGRNQPASASIEQEVAAARRATVEVGRLRVTPR